ncbi:MAG: aldehyde dehydrogenase [Candidatus Pacebacteria bacterium]|nr:aldehyde dehydrogenase [Candidatus Paceibacterota bacterium]
MSISIENHRVDHRHFIGGERVDSPRSFLDISPIDESPLGEVAAADAAMVDRAVAAAQQAFPQWKNLTAEKRAGHLLRVAELIEGRIETLAQVETADNGSLLRSHRRGVMPRVAHNFRYFAEELMRLHHDDFITRDHVNKVSWEGSGVAGIITPWNAPLMLGSWRIAPALAAGCTVVFKPPEWAPLTASLLADVFAEANVPAGVFNVVQGIGSEAGAALAAHRGLRRMAFTGSVATARSIAVAAGQNLVPLSFELGGKSPFIVFADADLDRAVELAVGQYDNAGQVCLAGTRILVEQSIRAEFLENFVKRARTLRQGDPRDEAIDLGPQISRVHFDRVKGFVERAKESGLVCPLGGNPNQELGGLYFSPTLFLDPPASSEIWQSEVFGPVLTLSSFSSEAEAIALANDTDYGLAAVIITSDRSRAERVSQAIPAGIIWNNCFFVRDLRQPFGGNGLSGIGREGGHWSFDFYADLKCRVFAPDLA